MAVLKDLIVHGASRFINAARFADIKSDYVYSTEGAFDYLKVYQKGQIASLDVTTLKATTARVVESLTVDGDLHTNNWTNSNIATIDGNFYITPTVTNANAKLTIVRNTASGTLYPYHLTLGTNGTNWATVQVPGSSGGKKNWTKGCKVLVTGDVTIGTVTYPLGTCKGILFTDFGSSGGQVLIDSEATGLNLILNEVGTISQCVADLKLSVYQVYDGAMTTSVSGSAYTYSGIVATAYRPIGILLTAKGTSANSTFIDIYGGVNDLSSPPSVAFTDPNVRIGNLEGLDAIGGKSPEGWGIYTDNGYFKGTIVSTSGQIGNFTINSALYSNGHNTWNYNGNGIYLNNDGISGGPGGKWWLWQDGSAKIGAMTLSSAGVLTLGSISLNASGTATIGPWIVNSTSIYKGNATQGTAGTGNMYFGNNGLSISNTFTVSNAGKLYATGADITGAIKAQSFIAYDYYGSAYRTRAMIDTNGLTIYDGNGTAEGNIQARFGFTATIGKTSGNNYNIYIDGSAINLRYNKITLNKIDSSGMTLYDGNENNNTNIIANFGKTISLGKNGSSRIDLNINNFIFYDKNNSPYFKIGQESVSTQSLLESRTFIANDPNGHSVSYTLTTAEQSNYANGTLTILLSYDRREVINPDYSITGSTLKVSYFSLSDPNYDGDIIIETYGGTSNDTPYLTFGSRKGTIGATSIAMGYNCIASGARAFAIGVGTEASDTNAIAVGCDTTANNSSAFAEGTDTIASGLVSHAAGSGSQATAYACYAIGNTTLAGGYASFAAGEYTKAQSQAQFVIGRYNNNKSTNVFEIGWGDSDNIRENIFEVNTSGNVIDGSGTQLINKAMIDCGTTSGVTIGANSTAYIDVDFHKTFSSKPIVVCSIYSTSTAYTDIGKIRCWVTSVSTTGCRIYFYNQASSQRAPAAYWQAIAI